MQMSAAHLTRRMVLKIKRRPLQAEYGKRMVEQETAETKFKRVFVGQEDARDSLEGAKRSLRVPEKSLESAQQSLHVTQGSLARLEEALAQPARGAAVNPPWAVQSSVWADG